MGIAVSGSRSVWDMWCAGVAKNVLGLQFVVVAMCNSYSLRCVTVAVYGYCSA